MNRRSCLAAFLCCLIVSACRQPSPNVLLVTFDTTRWDHVGYASDRSGLTPTLDELAARGTWFETATASAPITLPSHATILTGLEPYRHGVRNNGTYTLGNRVTTLAECLSDRGYRTQAVVSAFVLDSRFGLDQGFTGYDDDLTGASKQSVFVSREIPAEKTAAKAVAWLAATDAASPPFFLWVHFFDPHAGYEPPPDYLAAFPQEPYAAEIAYADAMLGRVIAELDRRHLLDNTLVVFLSDHGESLGQHGERTHGIFIYDATVRVPMFIAGPGVASGHRVGVPVRTVDVMPTILDLVGAPVPSGLDGISLRPLINGDAVTVPPAYAESMMPRLNFGWSELRGLRNETLKVILAPRAEAYDLKQDPGELDNLLTPKRTPSGETQALLEELRRLRATDPMSSGEHLEAAVEEETRAALEALGYTRSEQAPGEPVSADPKDRIAEFEALRRARAMIDDQAYGKAKTALDALIAQSPSNMDAILAMAYVHQRLDEIPLAVVAYERALEINPYHGQATISLARLLIESGQLDRAERILLAARSRSPGLLDLHVELGNLFRETSRISDAETSFRRALEIDPFSAAAALGLAGCRSERGDIETAIDILERAHGNNRHDPELVEQLASMYAASGDGGRSIEMYRQLVVLEPDNPSAWNNLASLLAQSGRYADASLAAQRAFELEPERIEIRANLGTMLVLAGRLEAGVSHLDAVVPRLPDDIYAAGLRAEALEVLGREDQALAAWYELARRDPAAALQAARIELTRHNESTARRLVADAIERGGNSVRNLADRDPSLRQLASEVP